MALSLIRLCHLAIVLYMFACLLYMIYCHIRNQQTQLLAIAYFSAFIESVIFLAFGRTCPLLWVDRQFPTGTADIFLPASLSAHITEAGISLLVIAVLTKFYQIRQKES